MEKIRVECYYVEEDNGVKSIRYKNLNGYKIYKVAASYGKNTEWEIYVRAFDWKQAKRRFMSLYSYLGKSLKILEIEETELKEEDFNLPNHPI